MSDNFFKLKSYLSEKKELVDKTLFDYLDKQNKTHLWDSIAYSLTAGGKRLRPLLTIATGEIFNTPMANLLPSACAIEMIHTQSLIHDDLPGMDNDELRRGKPTNHVKFGEAIAIIAGDALFAWAFNTITKETPKTVVPDKIVKVMEELSYYSGPDGMCGGQAVDIRAEKEHLAIDENLLKYIHTHKTGDMIKVSVRIGALLSGASDEELAHLTKYAENIGLAFQIVDDVMDVTSTAEQMGKKTKKDIDKATYPKFYGIDESMKIAQKYIDTAIESLSIFGEKAEILTLLAKYVIEREN